MMQVCFDGVVLLPFSHPHAGSWDVVRCGFCVTVVADSLIALGLLMVSVILAFGVQLISFFRRSAAPNRIVQYFVGL